MVVARRPRKKTASAKGRRFAILASGFHQAVSRKLVQAARKTLTGCGAADGDIAVLWVPGAFELPAAAAKLAVLPNRPDAIITLGALIRGGTQQYAVIAQAVATGLTEVSVRHQIPVTFGIIVAESAAQAQDRAGGGSGNRGTEAAEAAVELLSVFRQLESP